MMVSVCPLAQSTLALTYRDIALDPCSDSNINFQSELDMDF